MTTDKAIPRGADLTADGIALLADDVFVVCIWSMRNKLKREARLGRRPLVIGDAK